MRNNRKNSGQRYHRRIKNSMNIRGRKSKISLLMAGILLIIFLLLIYLTTTLCMLWKETVKYNGINANVGQSGLNSVVQQETDRTESNEDEMNKTEINENHISIDEYPEELIELLEKNAETEEFVLNYPLKKGTYSKQPLQEYLNKEEIPLLMQWDSRWGYYEYGSSVLGITGCGPTCLSMVAIYLLQNPTLTPIYMADYAQKNGYYVQGTGTSWEFMSRGASELGLRARELPLDENIIKRYLQNGNPIICIMGEGDFTDTGHFIVLVGIENGKIKINDPNSRERSKKLWEFEDIKYQIKNLWVYLN